MYFCERIKQQREKCGSLSAIFDMLCDNNY